MTKYFVLQSTFIHRVSLRVKQRYNREKKTKSRLQNAATTEIADAQEEDFSVEDAQKELKVIIISIIYNTIYIKKEKKNILYYSFCQICFLKLWIIVVCTRDFVFFYRKLKWIMLNVVSFHHIFLFKKV